MEEPATTERPEFSRSVSHNHEVPIRNKHSHQDAEAVHHHIPVPGESCNGLVAPMWKVLFASDTAANFDCADSPGVVSCAPPSTFCTRTRQIDDSDSGRPITINPHDRFFRHALVKPDISRGFFQRYLSSEVVDRLDLKTLTVLGESLGACWVRTVWRSWNTTHNWILR